VYKNRNLQEIELEKEKKILEGSLRKFIAGSRARELNICAKELKYSLLEPELQAEKLYLRAQKGLRSPV
jgi:hypothetical protein